MKRTILFPALLFFFHALMAQSSLKVPYERTSVMIPMRDGIRLYTVILSPADHSKTYPFLIQRTPYGAGAQLPPDGMIFLTDQFSYASMAEEGYIFVYQDIRGQNKSEGSMQIHQPIIHRKHPGAVDESTDTWDTIDWLVRQVKNNNGRAGITGTSYPGWLALVGAVDPHPALKASSEQACMGDLFLGDDFHHNGAFRLSYGMEYTYALERNPKKDSALQFPQFDLFNWYMDLGPLKHVNEKYFHGKIPTWNNFVNHPDYDEFWQANSPLSYVESPEVPQLHVGGYYDQEDMNGPQLMYRQMEKKDSFNRNYLVLGPWYHGQWNGHLADGIGKISFGSNTAVWFHALEKRWFDYYLKGIGDGKFNEAYAFQTGSNTWKTYDHWPPREATVRHLYAGPNQTAGFNQPARDQGSVSYVSDPQKPVPYRMLPIEVTYGTGSQWKFWQVEDQRFVSTRPDVVNFTTEALPADLTVTGAIVAHLFASTTGTDADWVIKLIDVYPDKDEEHLLMSGYALPVAMEVFRGRYRTSFSKPEALVPGKPEEFVVGLHDVNHVFRKGHHIMIQVQSSWFPVIDRNPQKFVPNIFQAGENDFIRATQTIYFSKQYPTHIDLPVMEENR